MAIMNPVKIITEFLEETLESTAASGDTLHQRIAMDRTPTEFDNTVTMAQVQHQSGRPAAAQAPVNEHQIAIKCYGGTNEDNDAWAVHERIYGVLHNAIGDTDAGGIAFCELNTVSKYYEPDTDWPVVVAIYQVQTV